MSDSDSSESSEEQSSSSECSTDSSDDDKLETVQLNNTRVLLPQGLCEKKEIYNEFFARTWNCLGEANQQYLRQFLPQFPENQQHEQKVTLQRLFTGENFKFSSPLDNFYEHLKAGHYRPDIAKMRYLIRKAERKESLWRHRKFKERLQAEIIESRKNLLRHMSNLPPGVEARLQPAGSTNSKAHNPIYNRTKRRYFDILSSIKSKVEESGFSSDDNYPDGPPTPVSRKDKRLLNTIKNSQVLNGEKIVISTIASKAAGFDLEKNVEPNHNPYIITDNFYRTILQEHRKRKFDNVANDLGASFKETDISISDIINRAKVNYKREKVIKQEVVPKPPTKKKIKREIPERILNYSSEMHYSSESDSDSATGPPVSELPLPPPLPPPPPPTPTVVPVIPPPCTTPPVIIKPAQKVLEVKKKIKTEVKPVVPQLQLQQPQTVPVLMVTKQEQPPIATPPPLQQQQQQPQQQQQITVKVEQIIKTEPEYITPATLSDLEGIDMMKLPIDLQDSNIDIMEISTKVELMQDTHANFLALIRDIICSTTEHRMDMPMLEDKLKTWQENPITALNDWYSLAENWMLDLQSAINFLSGNFPEQPDEFVPYIEYKPSLNKYQWIGAGRDSDNLLSPLFQYWLDHKSEMKPVISIKEKEEDKDDIELDLDRSLTPPPPRCPTDWQVRKADVEEVKLFREQERLRYDNPHKSFTYRCNGYESVVGPLKGIYTPSSSNTKARGHTMLSADRPNFVTILSLVRDATARLPNGEGTRGEICELLKCSQYISCTAPDNLLQSVVSGALDRMHTQFDPCVKYDPKRKIWIYLHRNRSEEDFERIHQQYQGMNKSTKKKKSPAKPKTPKVDKKNNIVASANHVSGKVIVNVVDGDKVVKEKIKQTSLLINQNLHHINNAQQHSLLNSNYAKVECDDIKQELMDSTSTHTIEELTRIEEDKEISQALQAITQPPQQQQVQITHQQQQQIQQIQHQLNQQVVQVVQQPTGVQLQQQHHQNKIKKHQVGGVSGKSLVKIITTSNAGGKSLIIPSSANSTLIKQDGGRSVIATSTKVNQTPLVTQQLLQSIAQQKQLIRVEIPDQKGDQKKTNLSIQQQILQSISPQQLQNIKNVTLLRNVRQSQGSIVLTHSDASGDVGDNHGKVEHVEQQVQQAPIRLQQGTLTLSQQQHLLQTIRQKGLAQMGGQQQVLIRHKTPVMQKSQPAPGTSLLGQTRLVAADNSTNKSGMGSSPIVAKVLTNAAGQVISVESLLAHQKQHGTLPQGTTLRVSGVKGGTNIIQLGSPQGKTSQTAVGQNNFITLTNQPKLVLSSTATTSATTTVTSSKPIAKTMTRPAQTLSKFPPKVAQQIINAKFIAQNVDGQKLVQPKVIIGQNQIKLTNKNSKPINIGTAGGNSNSIRMVNAANLNLAHLGGKPLLLASKGTSLQNIQGQNVIIQTQANSSTSSLLMAGNKNATNSTQVTTMNVINQSGQMVLAPQLKMQPQMLLSSSVKNANLMQSQGTPNQIIVGGHPVRLATSSSANAQRVVLASQGQGGQLVAQQILLPAGFQGTAINIKSLQGVKVIPIAQQTKGFQGRQVFARVMNPSSLVRTATVSAAEAQQTTPTSE